MNRVSFKVTVSCFSSSSIICTSVSLDKRPALTWTVAESESIVGKQRCCVGSLFLISELWSQLLTCIDAGLFTSLISSDDRLPQLPRCMLVPKKWSKSFKLSRLDVGLLTPWISTGFLATTHDNKTDAGYQRPPVFMSVLTVKLPVALLLCLHIIFSGQQQSQHLAQQIISS